MCFPGAAAQCRSPCQENPPPERDIKVELVTPDAPPGEADARTADILDLHPNDAGTIKINHV